ncbi:hypothetical protein SAMN05443572_109405 [Myxococcus fulvus]|uniref:Uncharacterized protein n=1 Tax=Myxococcus fulvus TaxID=33 RepID=A0A511T6F8_MYXFU|nr:hypothetical protein [Myxococcus fulvus]GEN09755.1 hypothetical protein MFU01_47920 [Myxococcus fulvus]SEU33877.1 hypothetical protein SAMN05443572_109405 [Myxococcus fulvus]
MSDLAKGDGAVGPEAALARLRALETLESGYEAWLELKLEHAASVARFREERERLTQQGSFLLGAVRAAGLEPSASSEPGLAPASAGDFLRDAEEKLARTREALSAREAETEAGYASAFAEIRATLKDRALRHLSVHRPRLTLLLRRVGAERSILHLERVSGDTPVLLCMLFTGRIPSRYGFLLDDSTEDVALPPAPLYPEEGVAPGDVRPDAAALVARVRAGEEVLPLKGMLPLSIPRPGGDEDFFRLLQRGAVLEVEVADGASFRNVLSREESERFAGHLLRLKLSGRIELDIEAG